MSVIARRPAVVLVCLSLLATLCVSLVENRPTSAEPPPRPEPPQPESPNGDAPSAQDERDQRARDLYLEGENDYAAGRYELAASKFEAAYELSGRSALLFNVANAYERMGDYQRAVRYLERYLESPKVEDVVSIRERIKRLQATIAANASSASNAAAPGAPEPDVLPREPVTEERAREPEPPPEPEPEPPRGAGVDLAPARAGRPDTAGRDASTPVRWPAYALFATSGVAVAGSVAFGLASRHAADEAAGSCVDQGGATLCLRPAEAALGRERRYALMSDIATGTALVTAGVGAYLLLRPARRARGAPPAPVVAPVVLPGGLGLGVAGAL